MKKIVFILACISSFSLIAQSITKIGFTIKDFVINEVVSAGIHNDNLSTAPGTKICGLNCLNNYTNQNEVLLFPFYNEKDISLGYSLFLKAGNISLKKLIFTGTDEVFFIGSYNIAGSSELMLFGIYSLKLKSIKLAKTISLSASPDVILNPVDLYYVNNNFYILSETKIQFQTNYQSKIVLTKFDGTNILWSYIYNSVAPIHSESPNSMDIGPNQNLCIGGTIKKSGDNTKRMMIAQIDLNGNPLMLKSMELWSADLTVNHEYGWTFIKSRQNNIHLFSQANGDVNQTGTVLVTLLDSNYILKTWRNYSVPLHVESSIIDGNFFLFGGQAPIELGYEGYSLMKVNAMNAIVEQFKNYKTELMNSSILTTSSSVYDRATDNIWTIVKPNGSSQNFIVLIENNGNLENTCAEDMISQVAKDPIQLSDIAFSARPLLLELSDVDVYVAERQLQTQQLCKVTTTSELKNAHIDIFPNPALNSFFVKSDKKIVKLSIYNVVYVPLFEKTAECFSLHIQPDLHSGIYWLRLLFDDKSTVFKKIVIVN